MKKALLSFLEASKLIRDVGDLPKKDLFIRTSASMHQLNLYLRAVGVQTGTNYIIKQSEFGTLKQALFENKILENEIIILFPWDFLGCLDWRTGFPNHPICLSSAQEEIDEFFNLVVKNTNKNIFYVDTPIPPVTSRCDDLLLLRSQIVFLARTLGARFLDSDFFCLKTYLSNACPFSSVGLSDIANTIISQFVNAGSLAKKIIVTDLDFTFWHGVLGEVGPTCVEYGPKGSGYIHFIYQSYLKKLKNAGVLLCISSKNDLDLVEMAFKYNDFLITFDEFVSINASYVSKSSEMEKLSNEINIGLSDFVFIDDNPIEIEEVKISLPSVSTIQFPKDASGLCEFFDRLQMLFPIHRVTSEDANRTALYKRMSQSSVSFNKVGDISKFLESLCMEIEISDRTKDNYERAIQLINKTNQFNLNGIRRSADEFNAILKDDGRLFTANLKDKNGDHGEVLAILMDKNNKVISFVMSCRVFQRQAEIIFILTVLKFKVSKMTMSYKRTERNQPFKIFLSNFFEDVRSGEFTFNRALIEQKFPAVEQLFTTRVT